MFQKISGIRNVFENERGGGGAKGGRMDHHEFPSEICCLTIPTKLVKEPFGVSRKFGYRKVSCMSGVHHKFLSKDICLSVPRNFVEEIFCVSEKFW